MGLGGTQSQRSTWSHHPVGSPVAEIRFRVGCIVSRNIAPDSCMIDFEKFVVSSHTWESYREESGGPTLGYS